MEELKEAPPFLTIDYPMSPRNTPFLYMAGIDILLPLSNKQFRDEVCKVKCVPVIRDYEHQISVNTEKFGYPRYITIVMKTIVDVQAQSDDRFVWAFATTEARAKELVCAKLQAQIEAIQDKISIIEGTKVSSSLT